MQVLFFVLGIMIRLCDTEGADAIHNLLDAEIDNSCYHLVGIIGTATTVQFCMLFAALSVILVPLGMLFNQLFFSRSTPILRVASTMEPPVMLLGKGERYHLFLSHVWSTGQDQCAVIKRQLQLLMPGVIIFLDVDDLQDIGNLENYVRQSGVMLFFLSRRYFSSRNCLREVRASVDFAKP